MSNELAVLRSLLDLFMQPGYKRRRAHPPRRLINCLFHRRGRVEADVVQPSPSEHGRLAAGLLVAVDLEDVQFCCRADVDDGHAGPARKLLTVALHGGAEHVDVEALEPVGVVSDHGHMVESLSEHGCYPFWICLGAL